MHHFVVVDVKGGFSVTQEEESREGGDLHLTCKANKYLYTALSWQRLNDTTSTVSAQQLSPGEYSNSLVLLLSNLTARDTGVYRCSANHLFTGKEAHLDTQVNVSSKCPPIKLLLLLTLASCFSQGLQIH